MPILTAVARWPESMPQYHLGHLECVGRIEARVNATPGLALAGNAYRGVGIPQVIHSGESAAERLVGGKSSLREGEAPAEPRSERR